MSQRNWEADRALCATASPGPWSAMYWDFSATTNPGWSVDCDLSITVAESIPGGLDKTADQAENDARFIAAARQRWPVALDEIDRLKSIVESLAARCCAQSETLGRLAENAKLREVLSDEAKSQI